MIVTLPLEKKASIKIFCEEVLALSSLHAFWGSLMLLVWRSLLVNFILRSWTGIKRQLLLRTAGILTKFFPYLIAQ